MFVATPPERSPMPFQDTWYQGPRLVMYVRTTSWRPVPAVAPSSMAFNVRSAGCRRS